MKYLIRAIKTFIFTVVFCALIITVLYFISRKNDGTKLQDIFLVGGFWYKGLAFFFLYSIVYPLIGYQKKEIYISNFNENKDKIKELFENANYILYTEDNNVMKFILKNKIHRLLKLYEDTVTINFSDNPIILDGYRKDVLRFSRGIEYICQEKEE